MKQERCKGGGKRQGAWPRSQAHCISSPSEKACGPCPEEFVIFLDFILLNKKPLWAEGTGRDEWQIRVLRGFL